MVTEVPVLLKSDAVFQNTPSAWLTAVSSRVHTRLSEDAWDITFSLSEDTQQRCS